MIPAMDPPGGDLWPLILLALIVPLYLLTPRLLRWIGRRTGE